MKIGLIQDMPAEQYHADPGVSNSMLSALNKSPAHCYALHIDPNRPSFGSTAAQSAGTLAHTMILEPMRFAARYTVKPEDVDYRTKDGKSWRDEQRAAGLEVITRDDHLTALQQREAVERVPALRNLLAHGVPEASAFWHDDRVGLRCRARPDWLHWTGPRRCVALDIKTISELTPQTVERHIAAYGYHRQAAHYTNGLRALGYEVEEFVFGFVSSSYPFLAVAYVLDDETALQGADEVAQLLDKFAHCTKHNTWPAFGDGYQLIGLPAWARRENEVEVSFVD